MVKIALTGIQNENDPTMYRANPANMVIQVISDYCINAVNKFNLLIFFLPY